MSADGVVFQRAQPQDLRDAIEMIGIGALERTRREQERERGHDADRDPGSGLGGRGAVASCVGRRNASQCRHRDRRVQPHQRRQAADARKRHDLHLDRKERDGRRRARERLDRAHGPRACGHEQQCEIHGRTIPQKSNLCHNNPGDQNRRSADGSVSGSGPAPVGAVTMTTRPERRNRSRCNGFEPPARGCSGIAELAPLLPIPYT